MRTALFFLLCAANISASAATLSATGEEAARNAALQWLQVVDSGNYKDAALMMSEDVRGTRDWPNYLAIQRGSLGRVNKRQIVEVKRASTIPGAHGVRSYAIVRFKTSFDQKSNAMEEVTLAKMGCCWEVRDYQISGR